MASVALIASCGGERRENSLVVPLDGRGSIRPTSIKQLSSAAIDSTRLSIAWVDKSSEGNRLWTCRVRQAQPGNLQIDDPPSLIEHGRIQSVTVFGAGGREGLLYTKSDQLLCRWPRTEPFRTLSVPIKQSVMSSGAIVSTSNKAIIIAVLIQAQEMARPTIELVGYVVDGEAITTSPLATLSIVANRIQSLPQLLPTDDGVGVGLLLTGNRVIRIAQSDTLQPLESSTGEFLALHLAVGRDGGLVIERYRRVPLADDHDLAYANHFAVVDSTMRFLVGGRPQVKIFETATSNPAIGQLSSAIGSGSISNRPTVQAMTLSDSTSLVPWIDTARQLESLSLSEGASDPTMGGGDLQARIVTRDGKILPDAPPGFPIQTSAQCLNLVDWNGRPAIVWVAASSGGALGLGVPSLHIKLLPFLQGR